jgi:hypothetical protein
MTDFYLSTLNSTDNATPGLVDEELARGDFESFAARFINGLAQQAHIQTNHIKPIGETTAVRIASDLFAFAKAVGGVEREFDYGKVREKLRLEVVQAK